MKTVILKTGKTQAEYTLIIESNNFGDQILSVLHEKPDGSIGYPWTETNLDGCHQIINDKFIENLKRELRIIL